MVGSMEGPSVRAKRPTWVLRKWYIKMNFTATTASPNVGERSTDKKRGRDAIGLI